MLAGLLALACSAVAAQATLAPHQQRALEALLATTDPAMHAMARPQIEQSLSMMNEAQVDMMLAAMADDAASSDDAVADEPPAAVDPQALAANRAQYEPALRRAWAADSAFDRFVDGRLAAERLD